MTPDETRDEREAREVLAIFTNAKPGEAVMDGQGGIWRFDGKFWIRGTKRVTALRMARALNPDLADLMGDDHAHTR